METTLEALVRLEREVELDGETRTARFEVVRVPPLRERQGDVAVLSRYFLREFLREVPALDLVDELGIDSMDLATIALVLQDEYKIVIDEDDYPKLKTVRLICEYIEEKLAVKH